VPLDMTRTVRWLGSVVLAVGLCLATTAPALAECGAQVNRWPAFSELAPSAERVIVGTVTEFTGFDRGSPNLVGYRVDVNEVLRGPASESIEVNGLKSGLPLVGSQSCRQSAYLYARVGDVIAFAFDGRLPGVDGPVNTAAWIEGKPNRNSVPGPQLLRLDEVRYYASLPDTSTVAGDSPVPALPGPSGGQLLLLAAAVAGVGIGHRRRLRRVAHCVE